MKPLMTSFYPTCLCIFQALSELRSGGPSIRPSVRLSVRPSVSECTAVFYQIISRQIYWHIVQTGATAALSAADPTDNLSGAFSGLIRPP